MNWPKSRSTPHINSFELGQHASESTMLQHLRPAFVLIVLFSALTGLVYPQITMPYQLEGAARRFEGARLGRRAASSHWRWRARVLEGPRRGVRDDAASAMLAAQDIERARQDPEVDATQRAQGSARDLAVSEPGRGGSGDDDLRREIRAQIRQGSRMPDQGSSDAADVLRPSRRSLGPLANFKPDRERVRDSEASHRPHEGRAVA